MRNIVTIIAAVFVITIFYPTHQSARAQSSDYTSRWEATRLIVGRLHRPIPGNNQSDCVGGALLGGYGTPSVSEIAIGVNQWTVKGDVNDGSKYKEVWSSAQLPNAFTYGGTWSGSSCQNLKPIISGNSNKSDWLFGFASNETYTRSAIGFRSVGITENISNVVNYDPGRVHNLGKTTSCQRLNDCLYATGGYGWTAAHEVEDAHSWKPIHVGVLMPLKWTIDGFTCPAGDNRCN